MRRLSNLLPSAVRLPRRIVQLAAGLVLYGVSMAFMVESSLGLNPWDVFHQGVSKATGISFGLVVLLTGIPVLLLWIPLRQRPGFGTIANLVVIGFVADGTLALLAPGESMAMRITFLVVGIALNGVATAMYLGARFGPGPRDGLMTGIARRWPRLSIRLCRTSIEVLVLSIGFLLGGTIGIGTVAYALGIGPLVQLFMPVFAVPESESADGFAPADGPADRFASAHGPADRFTPANGPADGFASANGPASPARQPDALRLAPTAAS